MNALTVRDLSKRYRGGTLANDRISLSVALGEVYALLGPNGAGKTTLVRQVLGLLKPTSGAIAVHGVDVVANPGFARRNVGFLPQGQFHMEMARIGEVIHSMARLRGLPTAEAKRRAEAVIARLDLEEFRKTPHFTASGGVKRLCGLASAIVGGQKVLVLDEPTNDVDPVRRQLLWGLLAELRADGAAILLVTHNLAEAERVIDRFAIIDRGQILREGTPASMRSLVTEMLRLELTPGFGFMPHPCLMPDQPNPGAYLFELASLTTVSAWLEEASTGGRVLDFRIGPPSLDDIYTAAVATPAPPLKAAS